MGRPGAGGGGSRVSGGRRMGQSRSTGTRAGSSRGSSGGGHRGPGGFGGGPRHHGGPMHHRGPMHHHHHHHGGPVYHHHHNRRPRRYYGGGSSSSDPLTTLLAFIIVFVIIIAVVNVWEKVSTKYIEPKNSYTSSSQFVGKTKLNTDNPYIDDCIKDEVGWFKDATATEARLKNFWGKTGVQPYIILKSYDAKLKTDKQKQQWVSDYYEEYFDTENIFLYVYFAEEDADNVAGFGCYLSGKQASAVMDEETSEIFMDNLDRYWVTDLSTDDMFVKAFNDTADDIME